MKKALLQKPEPWVPLKVAVASAAGALPSKPMTMAPAALPRGNARRSIEPWDRSGPGIAAVMVTHDVPSAEPFTFETSNSVPRLG
jgi:hypothetical protein